MSPLHSKDTDLYQGAFQNLGLISLSQASMAVAINRSWCGDRRFYSNLITNIKSHKPDGEVGVRNIHASSMNKREKDFPGGFHESFRVP